MCAAETPRAMDELTPRNRCVSTCGAKPRWKAHPDWPKQTTQSGIHKPSTKNGQVRRKALHTLASVSVSLSVNLSVSVSVNLSVSVSVSVSVSYSRNHPHPFVTLPLRHL